MKIGYIVDSSSYVSEEFAEKYNVSVVPLYVLLNDKKHKDNIDITTKEVMEALDTNTVIGKLKNNTVNVTTSQPAPTDYEKAYIEKAKGGYDYIFVITISSDMSGSFNSARLGVEMLPSVDQEKFIALDNRNNGSVTQTLIEFIDANKDNFKDKQDMLSQVQKVVSKSRIFFTVDNLKYLTKSGRIKKKSAMIGNLAKIKPILATVDGSVELVEKTRTSSKMMSKLVDKLANFNPKFAVRVSGVEAKEQCILLKEKLEEKYNNMKVIVLDKFSAVVSVHLGRGAIGVTFVEK